MFHLLANQFDLAIYAPLACKLANYMVTVNVEGFWKMTEYGHAIFKHSEIHKFM